MFVRDQSATRVSPLTFFLNELGAGYHHGLTIFWSFAGIFSSLAEKTDSGWDGAEAIMAKAALMNGHLVFWVSGLYNLDTIMI